MHNPRFQVATIRGGVFPFYEVRDTHDDGELIDEGADRQDLQDLADTMNALDNYFAENELPREPIRCNACGSTAEHVEMMAAFAGISDPICCDEERGA